MSRARIRTSGEVQQQHWSAEPICFPMLIWSDTNGQQRFSVALIRLKNVGGAGDSGRVDCVPETFRKNDLVVGLL